MESVTHEAQVGHLVEMVRKVGGAVTCTHLETRVASHHQRTTGLRQEVCTDRIQSRYYKHDKQHIVLIFHSISSKRSIREPRLFTQSCVIQYLTEYIMIYGSFNERC